MARQTLAEGSRRALLYNIKEESERERAMIRINKDLVRSIFKPKALEI